jgi:dynein light intermediate chain 2
MESSTCLPFCLAAYCKLSLLLRLLSPAGSQIFLTYRQVTTAVVVIVLDLSQPSTIIPTALQCLDLAQRKLAATYTLFERKGLQLPEQLRARQRAKLLSQHEDRDLVTCSGISIVLAGTKWDLFRDCVEAEGQRVLGRCLRCIAHAHGAHLLYLGGLQAAGGQGMSSAAAAAAGKQQQQQQVQPQQLLDNFCRLLSHVTFVGMDRKMPLKLQPQFDHLGALMIPAGERKPHLGVAGARPPWGAFSEAGMTARAACSSICGY